MWNLRASIQQRPVPLVCIAFEKMTALMGKRRKGRQATWRHGYAKRDDVESSRRMRETRAIRSLGLRAECLMDHLRDEDDGRRKDTHLLFV